METILAILLAMTVEVSHPRAGTGSADAHKPSKKSAVTKVLDVRTVKGPTVDEAIVCQPVPAAAKAKAKAKGAVIERQCVVIRPLLPKAGKAAAPKARSPRSGRVTIASRHKAKAKRAGKKKQGSAAQGSNKKWVPERVIVRPPVSIGIGR